MDSTSVVPHSSDRQRLEQALPNLGELLRQLSVDPDAEIVVERQFESGQSNPTYLIDYGGNKYVLRKQPDGNLLPKAHDVLREFNLMRALHSAGYPVPKPLLAVESRDAIGTSFFVMEYVPGVVESDPALARRAPEERRVIYRNMASALAYLHRLDVSTVGAAGVTARPGFVSRQVKIWRGQYLTSQTEVDDRIEKVADWLADNVPQESPPAVVHGDFRLENLILQGMEIGAVLDWELCAVGEPLCDLSYCCIWHHLPREVLGGLMNEPLATLGIPGETEFIDLYSRSRGADGHRAHGYFMAFSFYRLAAILQGVYKRTLDGNAASSLGLQRGRAARQCLERAEFFASGATGSTWQRT